MWYYKKADIDKKEKNLTTHVRYGSLIFDKDIKKFNEKQSLSLQQTAFSNGTIRRHTEKTRRKGKKEGGEEEGRKGRRSHTFHHSQKPTRNIIGLDAKRETTELLEECTGGNLVTVG